MKFNNYDDLVDASKEAHKKWRLVPAPQRGEIIREFGNELRNQKSSLAKVITREARKIVSEAEGEVQEAIDMCDFATGLSRQLYGLTMPSERPDHRLQEIWQPLGVVGCITAFNFPMAVFAWNFCLASVCGNSIIWKPSPHASGCADAIKKIWDKVAVNHKELILIFNGGNEAAIALCDDPNIPLISATGSTQMGKELAPIVSARLGRTLLELGGNNAAIICPTADLDLTVKGVTFSAAGTTGQRCTTLRRAFVHEDIYEEFMEKLFVYYATLKVGDPSDKSSQLGPLISKKSFEDMQAVLKSLKEKNIKIHGGQRLEVGDPNEFYVMPAIAEVSKIEDEMLAETFAPILYVKKFIDLKDAINMQNNVKQGLV